MGFESSRLHLDMQDKDKQYINKKFKEQQEWIGVVFGFGVFIGFILGGIIAGLLFSIF